MQVSYVILLFPLRANNLWVVLVQTIKKIINEMWGMELVDIAKLAKYLRCLIHITISDSMDIAGTLLDQAHQYAKAASEVDIEIPFVDGHTKHFTDRAAIPCRRTRMDGDNSV